MRQGIPTVEVAVGSFLREWEVAEIRAKILKRVENARLEIIHEERKTNTNFVMTVGERTKDL